MQELPKTYNPKEVEDKIYKMWEKSGAFKPRSDKNKKPFVIAIPPPNVTGSLHMGHALNNTLQDILIRRARMREIPTLWIPGTDHAGIATQNVVEKQLAKEGTTRQELGRDQFQKRVWAWVDEYGHIIIDQLKKLGSSCDWSRERFTMDVEYSKAVTTAFKHYYDKGLIYEGTRVINWCVHCQTALSDIEVEYKEQQGKLYYFRPDKDFPIPIATTRPETKLGDTAVAVNPNDKRYSDYVGKTFKINFCGVLRDIKIITDKSIDAKFGTGAVGVTPAHSLVDAELAGKYNLPSITVIDKYGRMTEKAGHFKDLKTKDAREKIVEILKNNKLLEKEEVITNNISVCYRCGREIEPQPSKQWFLKMKELAGLAIEAVESGEIKFVPERWTKVYLDWMENLHDWCISRQIWWGHRLPVFEKTATISNSKLQISNEIQNSNLKIDSKFKIENSSIYVGNEPPSGWRQVDDVLDTWFSSALWPFATLGWPDKTQDLAYFYPTTVLSTARDIIYLWVARMIFSGIEFMGKPPFSTVYIHPTIFNIEGKRMSKSLGTGIDPLVLIDKYGADAVRFGLTYINTGIQDIKFDEAAILAGQKFANKIWNIARFVMIQTKASSEVQSGSQAPQEGASATAPVKRTSLNDELAIEPKTDADKQITQSLNHLIASVNANLDNFRFGQAAHDLYDFVWHDFADVYLEASKSQLEDPKTKESTLSILHSALTNSLILLHPFMPFITEEIWQKLSEQKLVEEKMLITTKWPDSQ